VMVDRAVKVIVTLYFWNVNRGEVKNFSVRQDRLEASRGIADLDFSETLSHERIHDGGFNPFRDISLGFQ
jgi:hypothetical protein